MNKRYVLVTPKEAEFADLFRDLLEYVEISLHVLPADRRLTRDAVSRYLLKKIEDYILDEFPEEDDSI